MEPFPKHVLLKGKFLGAGALPPRAGLPQAEVLGNTEATSAKESRLILKRVKCLSLWSHPGLSIQCSTSPSARLSRHHPTQH